LIFLFVLIISSGLFLLRKSKYPVAGKDHF
jgi:hypothetical protein